jgi:hypothetical protein
MIYAQLLRTLLDAGIPLQNLFPVDLDEEVYADFPPSTQESVGWGRAFQTYVDGLYEKDLLDTPECVISSSALRYF